MFSRRRRRIVKRAIGTLAVVALLVAGYVSSYFTVLWLAGRGTISSNNPIGTIYGPLFLYQLSDLPGSDDLGAVAMWCLSNGERPLDKCRTGAIRTKALMRRPVRSPQRRINTK